MDKHVIIFLIKLFGTFAVLSLIIFLGKQLKSLEVFQEDVSYAPITIDTINFPSRHFIAASASSNIQ